MNKISKYFDIKTFISIFLSVLILYTICVRFLPSIGYKLYLKPIKQKIYKIDKDRQEYNQIYTSVNDGIDKAMSDANKYHKKSNKNSDYKTEIND